MREQGVRGGMRHGVASTSLADRAATVPVFLQAAPHFRPPEDALTPMIMVGPVAVMPGRQGEGFGKALMAASLGAIDAGFEEGAAPLPQVMIGDPDYYDRWGFLADHTGGWHCPGPYDRDRLLARTGNPAVLPAEGMLGPWNS